MKRADPENSENTSKPRPVKGSGISSTSGVSDDLYLLEIAGSTFADRLHPSWACNSHFTSPNRGFRGQSGPTMVRLAVSCWCRVSVVGGGSWRVYLGLGSRYPLLQITRDWVLTRLFWSRLHPSLGVSSAGLGRCWRARVGSLGPRVRGLARGAAGAASRGWWLLPSAPSPAGLPKALSRAWHLFDSDRHLTQSRLWRDCVRFRPSSHRCHQPREAAPAAHDAEDT